ncbi:MAG: AMP-binding protein, partial [Methylococcales bacterium]|nr:AMP-binding protein [Methylococcales bacterium]
ECYDLEPSDVMASMVHFDYYVGKLRLFSMMAVGGAYCLLPKNIRLELSWIERFKITVLQGSVFHFEQVLKNINPKEKTIFPSLKILGISMSTVSESLRKRLFEAFGVPLHIMYGTNECSALSALRVYAGADAMSVGNVLTGVEIEIVDTTGCKVPTGEIGEIRARSAATVDGYFKDTEASTLAFREGWFYPGDLGRFLENGELIYCGRSDHMMIMNGINIYPAEIEAIMITHPDVIDAAAMPIKHFIHQDIPVCALVLKEGSILTPKELLAYGYARLGARSPKEVLIIDQIPRNTNGKLIRDELSRLMHETLSKNKHTQKPSRSFSQPKRFWTIELSLPENIDSVHVERWLESLGIDNNISSTSDYKKHLPRSVIYQGLFLLNFIAQETGIPIFDTGEVAGLTPVSGNRYRVLLKIADIDHIPEYAYRMLIDTAFSTLIKILSIPITSEAITEIYELMHHTVITLRKKLLIGQSTLTILQTAYKNRIPFIHLGEGVYQLGVGKNGRKIDRSTTDKDSNLGGKLAHDKALSGNLLRMAGLPSPEHTIVYDAKGAQHAAAQIGWPLVVKPSDMERGEGVSIGVTDSTMVENAFKHARQISKNKRVLIEREVSGVCHRLFIVNNALLYALKRLPISVLADGESTIAELIEQANREESTKVPWKRKTFPSDDATHKAVESQGYQMESIPYKGEWIALRNIESTQWGGRDEEVTQIVHPDNLDIALRASALFELDVAGVDIITTDISIPWYENGAIINEINSSPLLGGGEISRGYLDQYLKHILHDGGKIPLEAFIGGEEAINAAMKRFKALRDQGVRCYLSSESQTFSPHGDEIYLPYTGINSRAKALALRKDAEALIFVLQTDEVLHHGFALGLFDKATICSENVESFREPGKRISTELFQKSKCSTLFLNGRDTL